MTPGTYKTTFGTAKLNTHLIKHFLQYNCKAPLKTRILHTVEVFFMMYFYDTHIMQLYQYKNYSIVVIPKRYNSVWQFSSEQRLIVSINVSQSSSLNSEYPESGIRFLA